MCKTNSASTGYCQLLLAVGPQLEDRVQDITWSSIDMHPSAAGPLTADSLVQDAFGGCVAGSATILPRLVAHGHTTPKQISHRCGGGVLAVNTGRMAITGGLGGASTMSLPALPFPFLT